MNLKDEIKYGGGLAAAILTIVGGLVAFITTKVIDMNSMDLEVSLPLIVSTLIYVILV